MKYRHTILAGLLALGTSAQAQVVINELMQSNIDCIMDDLNEFPDSWVELYNSGTEAVNLKDYKLGVKDNANKAWQLPNKTLKAKSYVVVYRKVTSAAASRSRAIRRAVSSTSPRRSIPQTLTSNPRICVR